MSSARVEFDFKPKGKIVSGFTLYYGSFVIRGFRVMESDNGYWIGMPSRKIGGGDRERWHTTVWMPDRKKKESFEKWVISEYYKQSVITREGSTV